MFHVGVLGVIARLLLPFQIRLPSPPGRTGARGFMGYTFRHSYTTCTYELTLLTCCICYEFNYAGLVINSFVQLWAYIISCTLTLPFCLAGTWELEVMRDHLREALSRVTSSLIKELTRRDKLLLERDRHFDHITAILQAASPKRSK